VTISVGPLLVDKVAIVTGGGGGMGGGISRAFGVHGAKVIVAEIDPALADETVRDIVAANGTASAVVADVRIAQDCDRVVASALDLHGRVDVLVNNVGHFVFPGKPFHETAEHEWQAIYETNLLHVLRMTHRVLPHMVEQRAGCVINVSTVEAFRSVPNMAVYGAFKAGVSHFTKCIAIDYGIHGIRANDIAPDLTQTRQIPYDRWLAPGDWEKVPVWVPVGRFGTPDDAGGIAVFLASDHASFLTGTTIHMDGGSLAAGGWFRTKRGNRVWTNRPYDP
jgi:NAD(P)-dependent dehydrogenase (short-subunit alcohol dehydrogenase family)